MGLWSYVGMISLPKARESWMLGFVERWSLVGFTGVGNTLDRISDLGEGKVRWAGGIGMRYLIARLLGRYAGVDVARGPEDWTIYFQVGHAWS